MFKRIKQSVVLGVATITVAASLLISHPVTAAASTCISPYVASGAAQVSENPSTSIGVIGQRAPAPGKPAWDGDDRINDMVYIPTSNLIVAAGSFSSYIWQGTTYPRNNIVAFNASTGQPTAFAPNVDGEILAISMTCNGSGVYIGGSFHYVNGTLRNYAAALDLTSGAVDANWNPNPNSTVEDINIMQGKLVIAGQFTTIGGAARTYISSVGMTNGSATGWLNIPLVGGDPEGPQKVTKVVPNHAGTAAVIIGNFNKVGGVAHRRIAVLQLESAGVKVAKWATSWTASNGNANTGTDCDAVFSAPDLDVTWTPDDSSFLTASTGGPHYNSICDSVTKWDGTALGNTNAQPLAQQLSGGDTFSAVVCSSVNCYASGHERFGDNPPLHPKVPVTPCSTLPPVNLGTGYAGYDCKGPNGVERPGVMEVSLSTMHTTPWDPGRSQQRGMHNIMLLTPQGLYLGSDGDNVGGQDVPVTAHNDLVLWPYSQ